jgi:phosphate transport system protein
MSHLEQRLENDLHIIRVRIFEQSANIKIAIHNAIQAMQTGDKQLAYATVLNDLPINRNMRAIDRLCHKFIAVHLPSGTHLRLLSSIIRANIELERMGDYAVVIAREGIQLSSPPHGVMAREIERMSAETLLMLKQSMKAFEELNVELAKSTKEMAANMEYNLNIVYQEITKETEIQNTKDLLALFVIFNQLKRIADQSKNLCEDAVFSVTGQQKEPKVYNILFIDEDNSTLSQLAESIARKNHPDICHYQSAGRKPAAAINQNLINFLNSMDGDGSDLTINSLSELSVQDISKQHLIVSLQGDVSSYFDVIPFHTSELNWELSTENQNQDMEILYRTLALHINDLMELLHGSEA